jgi:hypothetical protein
LLLVMISNARRRTVTNVDKKLERTSF